MHSHETSKMHLFGTRFDDGEAVSALVASAWDDRAIVATGAHLFRDSRTAAALCTAGQSAARARVLWVNAAFCRLSGYTFTDLVGASALVLAGAHVDAIHLREVELSRRHPGEMPFGLVVTKQRPDGSWYDVEERHVSIEGRPGKVTHYLLVENELSERQEAC